jgi:U3 small nucleolar RNA-associated protein 4
VILIDFLGIDAQPIVVPIREFGKEFSRALPFLPQAPPLASAPSARLLVSWWNCEIRIWSVPTNSGDEQRPNAVAKMALLGEENITSAAITTDGRILAVATVAEVRLFQLASQETKTGDKFSISKLHCQPLPGARLVQFSGNRNWLAIITPTNEVRLARLTTDDSTQKWTVLPHLVALRRRSRTADHDSLNGFWGNYHHSITHAVFSDDSTVLAVGELGGHIHAWVVEGNEDPTAAAVDIAVASSSASSSHIEDSENEEDEEKQVITIMGQHWRRHPNTMVMPKLDSAPLVLSFRPSSASSRPQPNGNPAVHATRRNPHPQFHGLPCGEQRLMIVTANHNVYEYDLREGAFSDWSRRNPTSHFPRAFTVNKDRTKGCFWDFDQGNQRIWLYGVNWLFMLDLSKDLPEPEASNPGSDGNRTQVQSLKKRKRDSNEEGPRKKASGAGDAIPGSTALSSVRTFTGGEVDESRWISMDTTLTPDLDEDEDVDLDVKKLTLPKLRRNAQADSGGDDEDVVMDESHVGGDDNSGGSATSPQKSQKKVAVKERGLHESWWHTFKYRPILGIVPIGERSGPLEVVLVERPAWDLDLPARFVGAHERAV